MNEMINVSQIEKNTKAYCYAIFLATYEIRLRIGTCLSNQMQNSRYAFKKSNSPADQNVCTRMYQNTLPFQVNVIETALLIIIISMRISVFWYIKTIKTTYEIKEFIQKNTIAERKTYREIIQGTMRAILFVIILCFVEQ